MKIGRITLIDPAAGEHHMREGVLRPGLLALELQGAPGRALGLVLQMTFLVGKGGHAVRIGDVGVVLEHLERSETLAFLRAMFAALRPGGQLILRTANGAGPLAGRIRYADFTHLQSFTLSSISQVLRLAGFERIRVLPEGPRVHGAISAARWMLWQGINAGLRLYLATETGQIQREIFTRNLIAVAHRSSANE